MDRPVAAAEPVISRTSRFWTVSCIQVPAFETKFATDHQRMLRCLKDRHGERDALPVSGGVEAVFGAGEGAEDTVRYPRGERSQGAAEPGNGGCAARPLHLVGHGADHGYRRGGGSGGGAPCRTAAETLKCPCSSGVRCVECG
ncbi:hypothetical protein GCM10010251_85230 [Streptomyces aurantiogriseus]|uniref:Uncharacterized protein n=1 Tax=Streptomyces aurantiogriseus TaxID=66870 RepID=A0A918FML4_9ACTN|nr:hypothetical protein GCM10010251_85230 [Streptomyces aurantiogriseus]